MYKEDLKQPIIYLLLIVAFTAFAYFTLNTDPKKITSKPIITDTLNITDTEKQKTATSIADTTISKNYLFGLLLQSQTSILKLDSGFTKRSNVDFINFSGNKNDAGYWLQITSAKYKSEIIKVIYLFNSNNSNELIKSSSVKENNFRIDSLQFKPTEDILTTIIFYKNKKATVFVQGKPIN